MAYIIRFALKLGFLFHHFRAGVRQKLRARLPCAQLGMEMESALGVMSGVAAFAAAKTQASMHKNGIAAGDRHVWLRF